MVKRTAGGKLVSPFWCTNFLLLGKRWQKPTPVLIGDDEETSKAAAETWVERIDLSFAADAEQVEVDRKTGFRKGTIGEAFTAHLETRIQTSDKVVAARDRGEDITKVRQVASYLSAMGVILRRFPPNTLLDDITGVMINAWRDDMVKGGKQVSAKVGRGSRAQKRTLAKVGLKKSTINKYLTILKTVLKRAHEEWGMLKKMPTFKKERVAKRQAKALAPEDVDLVIDAAIGKGMHIARYLTFLLFTGARKTEAVVLTWPRLDLAGNAIAYVNFVDDQERR